MKIALNKRDYESIISRAKSELPNEACGLIAGEENVNQKIIKKVYAFTNMDNSPEHFSLSPKEQLEAIKDMRRNGLKLLGNWHSHPSSPSRPSAEDIRLAFDRNMSYLILSLMEIEKPVLKSFHIENGVSTQEELILID